jgi:hypothetical protein
MTERVTPTLDWHTPDVTPENGQHIAIIIGHPKMQSIKSISIKFVKTQVHEDGQQWSGSTDDDDGSCQYYYPEWCASGWVDEDFILSWAYVRTTSMLPFSIWNQLRYA